MCSFYCLFLNFLFLFVWNVSNKLKNEKMNVSFWFLHISNRLKSHKRQHIRKTKDFITISCSWGGLGRSILLVERPRYSDSFCGEALVEQFFSWKANSSRGEAQAQQFFLWGGPVKTFFSWEGFQSTASQPARNLGKICSMCLSFHVLICSKYSKSF